MAKRPRTRKAPAGAAAAPAVASEHTQATAPETAVAADKPDGDLTRVLVSSVSPRGRRRAGQGFGPDPIELHVSDATLELLEGDPQLIVKRD